MRVFKFGKIIIESYKVLLGGVAIAIAAGHLLHTYSPRLTATVLMMVPLINGLGGNLGSLFGARLSSALHLGTIEPKLKGQETLQINLSALGILGGVIFIFAGGLLFGMNLIGGASLLASLKASFAFLIAGLILTVLIALIALTAAFASYTRGIDPDNVVIPIVTSTVDLLGITCLLITVHLLGV
ncbi:hypothetical protein AKJ44_00900 [candidate division MSBL1 archaeon SCGC-AAA261F17]|uniref:SLC41A/MgtE integral membrane domain-containing protein n=1 Tax=candidate division MSBL1 archaeon SCGC-AAA261F17 TaxID=1698274 RepID=A0A133V735_9EURY|nr:hypothetical protein AKJ44_00900 [candidate division MSBL1 archaeon SCGC-AAA261F17]